MRNSDRWVTPGVIVAGILTAGLVVLGTVAAVAWLSSIGRDPDPMLKLVGALVAAVTGIGNLLLTIAQRATTAKTERNTGVLADAVFDVAEALPKPFGAHAAPQTVVMHGAAPAPPGSK